MIHPRLHAPGTGGRSLCGIAGALIASKPSNVICGRCIKKAASDKRTDRQLAESGGLRGSLERSVNQVVADLKMAPEDLAAAVHLAAGVDVSTPVQTLTTDQLSLVNAALKHMQRTVTTLEKNPATRQLAANPINRKATRAVVDSKPIAKATEFPLCKCGCGKQTRGGTFCQGHDARYHSMLRKAGKEVILLKDVQ